MDGTEFEAVLADLAALDGPGFSAVAAAVREERETVDGEVARWRATTSATGVVRRCHLTRKASAAAHRATAAVLAAARRNGLESAERDKVTVVARAAAELATALVAAEAGGPDPALVALRAPWRGVLPAVV